MSVDAITIPIIVGSGRSGTTWVQDALAQANGYATVFEPLHPEAIPAMAAYAGRYLRAEDRCDELESYLQGVFSGRTRNAWITYRVRPDRLAFRAKRLTDARLTHEWLMRWKKFFRNYARYRRDQGKPLLVKFIRANLMLPWLASHFSVRIAAVVRHAGAVVESKMRLGGDDWEPDAVIEHYRSQSRLMAELPDANAKLFNGDLTPAGKHALIWCMENKLLMERAADWGVVLVFYEDLLDASNEGAWKSIVKGLGLKNLPDITSRRSASQQASPLTAGQGYDSKHFGGWYSRLSSDQVEEIQHVLDAFEVDQYRMNSMLPCRQRV